MKQFIADRHTTPATPVMDPIGEAAIPLYPTEQDLLDDLANLEVGQIAGTVDPAESELIGVLIQKIQALESKLESDDVYSTDEVKTNKKWINGKPIYRKCFYSDSWVDASTYDASDLDIDEVTSLKAMWLRSGDWFEAPFAGSGGFYSALVYHKATEEITFLGPTHAGSKNRTIIEYTKTTDD